MFISERVTFNIYYAFKNVERPVQTPSTLILFNNCVEHMLTQMLKPLKVTAITSVHRKQRL